MQKATPIFILCSARSGTTWLANLLGNHPDIASIACVEHHGIHESHIFDHTRYCFPNKINCCDFIEKYREEDYFKLLGFGGQEFFSERVNTESVFYWSRQLMDEYARR